MGGDLSLLKEGVAWSEETPRAQGGHMLRLAHVQRAKNVCAAQIIGHTPDDGVVGPADVGRRACHCSGS
jgi:hypothetical protein